MARQPAVATAAENGDRREQWVPPTSDQEWEVGEDGIAGAPGWIDKGWAGFDRGPAIALPAGDLYGEGPYHTITARPGDKVIFTAAKGAMPAKFSVIQRDPFPEDATKKPAQQSAASLEDLLKQGYMTPDDLGSDAKAQVAGRSPRLKNMIEKGEGAPAKQDVNDALL